jgi:hypothetical protein
VPSGDGRCFQHVTDIISGSDGSTEHLPLSPRLHNLLPPPPTPEMGNKNTRYAMAQQSNSLYLGNDPGHETTNTAENVSEYHTYIDFRSATCLHFMRNMAYYNLMPCIPHTDCEYRFRYIYGTTEQILRSWTISIVLSLSNMTSCFSFKTQRFGDWILSPSSGKTYSVGSIRQS